MKFLLAFERTHRVLRAKAAGVIATQDLLDLDIALIAFLAREETAEGPSIRGLYDFSEVAAVAVPQTKAAEARQLLCKCAWTASDGAIPNISVQPRGNFRAKPETGWRQSPSRCGFT
jgi:hypothetical protein